MSGCKCSISLIVLVSLLSTQAYSQQINSHDSLTDYNFQKVNLRPVLHYSVSSAFIIMPHFGSVTGFTVSPSLSIPISPKLSVDGGIIAGRFYSTLSRTNAEVSINGAFSELSVFGSATYHINPQLTLYGVATKQLTGTSPFNFLPSSSYAIGSTYRFGNSSIGITLQMSKWNDIHTPFPFNSSQGFYSPY